MANPESLLAPLLALQQLSFETVLFQHNASYLSGAFHFSFLLLSLCLVFFSFPFCSQLLHHFFFPLDVHFQLCLQKEPVFPSPESLSRLQQLGQSRHSLFYSAASSQSFSRELVVNKSSPCIVHWNYSVSYL